MADAGGIRAGRAYVELGVNDKIAAGLARARARLLAFSATLRGIGDSFQRVGVRMAAFGVGAAGALGLAVRSFASQGDTLDKMSKRTGMSVESLSELSYAAELSGTSIGDVEKAARLMQRSLVEAGQGSKVAREAFQRLGLSVDALMRLNADQQFDAVSAALARVSDPATRTAAALQIFGRSGTNLLPMLAGVENAAGTAAAAVARLGLVVNDRALAGAGLGVSAEALAGLGAGRKAETVADALSRVQNPARRAALALSIFGDNGRALLPTLVTAADGLAGLRQAASAAGGALRDDVDDSIVKLSQTIRAAADGSKTAADALGRLGLSAGDLAGLKLDTQFAVVSEALAKLPDPGQRAAAALAVFGKGARSLLPFVREATGGLAAMRAEARALGITISTQDAAAAARLSDAFSRLRRVLQSAVFTIGGALAPALTEIITRLTVVARGVASWVDANRSLVVTIGGIAAGVIGASAALVAAGVAFKTAGVAISGLAAVLGGLKAATLAGGAALAALASPIGLVVAALGTLGAVVVYQTGTAATALQWLMQRFGELQRVAGRVMGGIADAMATGDVQAAAVVLWAALKATWQTGAAGLLEVLENLRTGAYTAMSDFATRMERVFIYTCYGIARAIHEVIAFLKRLWVGFTEWFLGTTGKLVARVEEEWIELRGTVDPWYDVEAARASASERADQRQARIADEADAKRAQIEQARRDAADVAKGQRDRAMKAVADAQAEFESALVTASAGRINAAQAALKEAQGRLRYALAQAKLLRESAEGWAAPGALGELPAMPAMALPTAANLAAAMEQKIAVQGTFLASSVGGLAGASTAERTARGVEKLVQISERAAGNLEQVLTADA